MDCAKICHSKWKAEAKTWRSVGFYLFSTSVEVREESDGRQEGDVLRNQLARGYFRWKAK